MSKGSRFLTNLNTNRSQDSDKIRDNKRGSRNEKLEEAEKALSPTMARFSKDNAYLRALYRSLVNNTTMVSQTLKHQDTLDGGNSLERKDSRNLFTIYKTLRDQSDNSRSPSH